MQADAMATVMESGISSIYLLKNSFDVHAEKKGRHPSYTMMWVEVMRMRKWMMNKINKRTLLAIAGIMLVLKVCIVVAVLKRRRPVEIVTDPKRLSSVSRAYFAGFNAPDRAARKCGSSNACSAAYVGRLVTSPPSDVVKALHADASKAMSKYRRGPPIKVAVLQRGTEDGWPHTHGDVVCLPLDHFDKSDTHRVETLIHEMIHVEQRERPSETRRIVEKVWGYRPIRDADVPDWVRRSMRSNPDLDGKLYASPVDGLVRATLFNKDTPANLSDSRLVTMDPKHGWRSISGNVSEKYEHPNERMAYEGAARAVSTTTK